MINGSILYKVMRWLSDTILGMPGFITPLKNVSLEQVRENRRGFHSMVMRPAGGCAGSKLLNLAGGEGLNQAFLAPSVSFFSFLLWL